ncbi:unnamed protein product [Thelazia callipaeda]|uniref:EGF-like domain-containing protein n=1 Tax=Thelazia callipaeda TaxID=103827 RepID=A0A0N5D556_THECL|nr:unnamed protein product [Thelazia callipaeda]
MVVIKPISDAQMGGNVIKFTVRMPIAFKVIAVDTVLTNMLMRHQICLVNYNLIFGQCPNGQISQVRCSAQGQCDQDQICLNGLCCTRTEFDYRYPCGGITALGNCTNKNCTGGLSCTASGFCCECPVGLSGGECKKGNCPSGFKCMENGYCCTTCPNDATPYGACRNGVCGGSTMCFAGNICC